MNDQPDTPPAGRSRLLVWALAAAVVLVVAIFAGRTIAPLVRGTQPRVEPRASAPGPGGHAPAAAAPTQPVPAPEETPSSTAKPRPRRRVEPKPAPADAPPPAPTTGELRIDSDVPGAMVFLDRKFLGNAPVTARDVAPGSHQLNASADGYDGLSESIEVSPGPRDVMLRFKEIRLKATVDVVHKHGMGSCEGRLLADPQGIRYETTDKDDAFALRFADVESFEVDYMKKNLRVKRRGGKTWNFTTKHENADPLFVFHRDVDKVRKQLAGR